MGVGWLPLDVGLTLQDFTSKKLPYKYSGTLHVCTYTRYA